MTEELERFKSKITFVSLVFFAVITLIYSVIAFMGDYTLKYVHLFSGLFLLIGIGLHRISYVYSAMVLTLAFMANAAIELATFGMNGSHLLLFTVGSLYSGLMISLRYGLIWLSSSIAMMGIIIYLIDNSYLPEPLSVESTWLNFQDELVGAIYFAGITLLVSALLKAKLENSLEQSYQLVDRLSSEIKEKEHAVASGVANRQSYELLADNVSDVVFTLSPNMEPLYTSPSVQAQRGFTPEEIAALDPLEEFSPETLPEMGRVIQQVAEDIANNAEQPFYMMEYELSHKNGGYIWIESRVSVVRDESGEVSYLVGVNRDISQRKQAEAEKAQLEANIRMLQRNESLAVMAGGVAHDFNNILVAIMGYADLSLGDDIPAHTRENLEGILRSTRRAASLTEQLLAFGRRQQFDTTTFDVRDLVLELQQMMSRLLPADISLSHDLCQTDVKVEADRGQLEQVIVNLVINARDAMPAGGKLGIKVSIADQDDTYLTLASSRTELDPLGYVKVEVSDSGHGIPDDVKEHMFEPFFTTKDEGKGTGLGLAVVLGIIDQHDGFLDVATSERGTTFSAYLPLTETALTPESVLQTTDQDASSLHGKTILCVDDNEDVRKVASMILKRANYEVIEAADGAEAVEQYKQNRESIDLILLDIVMPNVGGKDAFDQLQELKCEAPIIFTSGYHEDSSRYGFVQQSGSRLLKKPYSRVQLLELIEASFD